MAWVIANLRRLQWERSSAVGFTALLCVTSMLASAGPRALDQLGDDTLQAEFAAQPLTARNLEFVEARVIPAGAIEPLGAVKSEGQSLFGRMPAAIQGLIERQDLLVESVRRTVDKPGLHDPSTLRLRIEPAAAGRIRWVAGVMPSGRFSTSPDGVVSLEVALSAANATALGVRPGDTIKLETDPSDVALALSKGTATTRVTITGLFEVTDPEDPAWLGDSTLAEPSVRRPGGNDQRDAQFLDMAALLSPGAYQALLWASASQHVGTYVRYTFADFVDPHALRQRDIASLVPAFRRLQVLFPDANPKPPLVPGLRTSLGSFLASEASRWAAAIALLAVAAVGPTAAAVAGIVMVATLAGRRRRAALSLTLGRGASLAAVAAGALIEGFVLAAPAAALGAAIGARVSSTEGLDLPARAGFVVAVGGVAALTMAMVPRGDPGVGLFQGGRPPQQPIRRLALEGLLILLASLGAFLLRDRGLKPDGTVDPFITVAPALVAVVAGLLALRLSRLPTSALAWIAARRRGLVGLIAMRRAAGGAGAQVLLVLLATMTIVSFSSAALNEIDHSADGAGWQTIGADFRVRANQGYLPRNLDFGALPGVTASARMFEGTADVGTHSSVPTALVLDVEGFEEVTGGTPADPHLPAKLLAPAAQPVPVVIAKGLESRPDAYHLGETLVIDIEGYIFEAKVVADLDAFPGVEGDSFIIASEKQLRTLFPAAPLPSTTAFLRAPAANEQAIRGAVTSAMSAAVVDGRLETAAAHRDAPVARAVRVGIAAAAVIAALYAALAVSVSLALGGAARAVENAQLRTLGLSDRQVVITLLLEQGPAVLLAFVSGLGVGLGLLALLEPGLRLNQLVGSDSEISPSLEPSQVVALFLELAFVTLVGMLMSSWLGARVRPGSALRGGLE